MSNIDSQILPNTSKRSLRRRRYRPQARQRLIEQFENGEQNLTEFCEENGLCRSSLWRWLAQRRREEIGVGALVEIPARALQQPAAAPAVTGTATVKVELAGGMRLEIVAGTDPAWIAALVRALERMSV